MKYTWAVIWFILVLCSCGKEDPNEVDYSFQVVSSDENSALLTWQGQGNPGTVNLTFDTDKTFSNPVNITDIPLYNDETKLTGLSPMTNYYLKIDVIPNGKVKQSELIEFSSGYTVELVQYKSTLNATICANICYISSLLNENSKVAVFMHRYMSNKNNWFESTIPDTLIKDGYLCIAIDFKNHGCSTKDFLAYDILTEPWIVREDFDATLDYLETLDLVHADEIVVFGASIGACVATCVSSYDKVIGGVAASANKYYTEKMSISNKAPRGMFYLAGALDVTTTSEYEADAFSLSELTENPTKVYIEPGTTAHGVDLFSENTELETDAIEWVRSLSSRE